MEPWEEAVILLRELNATAKELNATAKKQLEIQGLEFALEPLRYITRKHRTGDALISQAAYYQLIAPAATFVITFTNPEGYVWVGMYQDIAMSQTGVLEFTAMVDDQLLPYLYLPRLTPHVLNWNLTLPFSNIIKDTTTITYVNHDVIAQWIAVVSIGIFLRKDVWERDSRLMDQAAEKYIQPPPPAPPALPK